MSNHLDRKSLVTKGFIRKQKDFDVIRIKNDSFVSNTINPQELFNVFFVLRFLPTPSPTLWKNCQPCKSIQRDRFPARDQGERYRADKMGPSYTLG